MHCVIHQKTYASCLCTCIINLFHNVLYGLPNKHVWLGQGRRWTPWVLKKKMLEFFKKVQNFFFYIHIQHSQMILNTLSWDIEQSASFFSSPSFPLRLCPFYFFSTFFLLSFHVLFCPTTHCFLFFCLCFTYLF